MRFFLVFAIAVKTAVNCILNSKYRSGLSQKERALFVCLGNGALSSSDLMSRNLK